MANNPICKLYRLQNGFDFVRERLWFIKQKYFIPEKIVVIVRLFYDNFQCAVEDRSEIGKWSFGFETGVKQGGSMSRCQLSRLRRESHVCGLKTYAGSRLRPKFSRLID